MLRNLLRRLQITLNDSNLFYIEEVLVSEMYITQNFQLALLKSERDVQDAVKVHDSRIGIEQGIKTGTWAGEDWHQEARTSLNNDRILYIYSALYEAIQL
jgi:hypothetical protein